MAVPRSGGSLQLGQHVIGDIVQVALGERPARHNLVERLSLVIDSGRDGAFEKGERIWVLLIGHKRLVAQVRAHRAAWQMHAA